VEAFASPRSSGDTPYCRLVQGKYEVEAARAKLPEHRDVLTVDDDARRAGNIGCRIVAAGIDEIDLNREGPDRRLRLNRHLAHQSTTASAGV
jgi:hypothetical protein